MPKPESYYRSLLSSEGLSDIFGELTFPYVKHKDIRVKDLPQIRCSQDIYNYINPVYETFVEEREIFYTVFLNRSSRIIGRWFTSMGSLDGTIFPIDMIAARALKVMARAVVVIHNHPSENKNPSEVDVRNSKKLKNALGFFDIPLLDSLIITKENGYLSLADEGLL